jgi:glycosyltransferase involved in cell wall biosynthesis
MKILYFSQFFYPEITAGAFRAYEQAKIWAKEDNVDVTVYTANPNYPKGEIFEGYVNRLILKEEIEGMHVIRGKVNIKKNISKLGRLWSALSFMVFALINLVFSKRKIGKTFDVVLGSSGPIFAGVIAYIYSIAYRANFVFEIRDLSYLQMMATMNKKEDLSVRIMRGIELFLCKRAKRVIVVTEGFKQRLIQDGIDSDKITVIYNGVIIKHQQDRNIKTSCKVRGIQKEGIVLTYAGTLGVSQQIEELIDFFVKLKNTKKELYLIGEGAQKQALKKFVKEHKIEGIYFIDAMPSAQLEVFFEKTDFAIVKLKYTSYFSNTIPSKVFDLLSKGVPILYLGPKGEVAELIEKANAGLVLTALDNAQNVKLFEEKLNTTYIESSNKGQEIVEKYYNRQKLSYQYLQILKGIRKRK